MNIFNRLFKRNAKATFPPEFLTTKFPNQNTYLGKDATAFAAIDKIANSFAALDFGIYSYDTREKQRDHYLYKLLKEPNKEETHSIFFTSIIQDYFNSGNVYLFISRDADNIPVSLFRINPKSVDVTRDEYTNEKIFKYKGKQFTANDILHVPSRWDYNGLVGKSIFDACGEIFNTSLALDAYTKNTFENSLGKRLAIDISKAYPTATPEQIQRIREQYQANYAGVENAGTPIIKAPGVEYETIDSGLTDNRAQELQELRNFQRDIIAELFQIPVDYLTGCTSKDLETLTTLYTASAIQPLAQIFQESFIKLLNPLEKEELYLEFDFNGLIRTSLSSRVDVLVKQLTNGMISPNEARKMENRSELPEAGNNFFMPVNLAPLNNEYITAYMAKQKQTAQQTEADILDSHSLAGDDKI